MLRTLALLCFVGLIFETPARSYQLAQTQSTQPNQNQAKPAASPSKENSSEEIDPDDVIRVNTNLVNAPVLVMGRNGKYIPSLTQTDFEIYEDGVKQEIAYFAPVEKPFTIALLLDTSRSTTFELEDIQDAAVSVVDRMRDEDMGLVLSFADEVKVLAKPTTSHQQLRNAIRASRPGGSSRVYDAIDLALQQLQRLEGRKALIVFTDGVDNGSKASFEGTLQQLQRTDVLVYPVQFNTYDMMTKRRASNGAAPEGSGFNEKDYQLADTYLHQAAEATGTSLQAVADIAQLDRAVAQIVDELHNEYSIGYYPRTLGQTGEARRVEVRVKQPQLVVRSRSGYVVGEKPAGLLPTKPASAADVDRSTDGAGVVPRISDQPGASLDAMWVCKSTDVPTDLVVVKEGFISHCPSSEHEGGTNAWFIRKPGPTETMCKGYLNWRGREVAAAPIPTGYVVTGEVSSSVCSKSNDPKKMTNAWTITLPQFTDTICKGFTIPRGFVVAGEKDSANCPAKRDQKNAWRIRAKK